MAATSSSRAASTCSPTCRATTRSGCTQLIANHLALHRLDARARTILDNWASYRTRFVKVMPVEYRRALHEMERGAGARERRGGVMPSGAGVDPRARPGLAIAACRTSSRLARSSPAMTGRNEDENGQGHGISRDRPARPQVRAGVRPHPPLSRVHAPARRGGDARPGGALHGLRHPVLPRTDGCPVNNQIPDWNDLVYQDDWDEALRNLHSTNNFPEFTGRVCPAPCEAVLHAQPRGPAGHHQDDRACAIADRAWQDGLDRRRSRPRRSPASASPSSARGRRALPPPSSSRASATRCMSSRRTRRAGGLLRYGIPDFKMEKHHIDRRVEQMEAEGVIFHYGVHVGVTDLGRAAPATSSTRCCFAGGAEKPRDLALSGPRSRRRPFRHGFPAAAEPARRRREHRCRRARSSPPASMSSSSAAATPAPTASAPRSARARCRSPSSRSCRSRPSGRTSC